MEGKVFCLNEAAEKVLSEDNMSKVTMFAIAKGRVVAND